MGSVSNMRLRETKITILPAITVKTWDLNPALWLYQPSFFFFIGTPHSIAFTHLLQSWIIWIQTQETKNNSQRKNSQHSWPHFSPIPSSSFPNSHYVAIRHFFCPLKPVFGIKRAIRNPSNHRSDQNIQSIICGYHEVVSLIMTP